MFNMMKCGWYTLYAVYLIQYHTWNSMFILLFILTVSLFVVASAAGIYSLHSDEVRHYRRAKTLFYVSTGAFVLLGLVRIVHIANTTPAAFSIWAYFYMLDLLLILLLIYLGYSRWKNQWKPFFALAVPFITLILIISIPFLGSARKMTVDMSQRLLPVHVVIAALGELLFFFSFAGSVLYLVMEGQLRKKRSMKFIYRLPTLETIENFNRWSILRAFVFLSLGLALGIFMACVVYRSPFLGTPKEIVLYASWLVLLLLFYLRYSGRLSPRRMNQVNVAVFVLFMFFLIFTNIYITRGFHSFQ